MLATTAERLVGWFPWRATCRRSAPARAEQDHRPGRLLGGHEVAKKKVAKKKAAKKVAKKKKKK
jgi:hypothetical protein